MPWKTASTMSLRLEFVRLAMVEGSNIRQLSQRFGISPKTAYKWIHRYHEGDADTLKDQSQRPHHNPTRTSIEIEKKIVDLRKAHPAWGARKLKARLMAQGLKNLPSISTMTAILKRYGCIDRAESSKHQAYQRFEADAPNVLWQMDFKGWFSVLNKPCHPLTVLDDHSRFSVGLYACGNQTYQTVQKHLTSIFRCYGVPNRILADNGGPWGTCGMGAFSYIRVWLIHLGIALSHSRVRHPQTLGKDERFHRTLNAEVISRRSFDSLKACQHHFDIWRHVYNLERPHQALDMAVPASRYQPSTRQFPEILPPIEYGPEDVVRKVDEDGAISFRGKPFRVGRAFHDYPVAIRPTLSEGVYKVFFCHQPVSLIDLNKRI